MTRTRVDPPLIAWRPWLSFDVPGEARAWARARRGGARYFVDERTASYKRRVATVAAAERNARALDLLAADVPVRLHIVVAIGRPASARRRLAPTRKPDLDNFAKAILDACNRVLWLDDAQVVELTVRKLWGDSPGAVIAISDAGEPDWSTP